MKISARLATILSAIFALACLSVALTGFTSLDPIVDPVQRGDAKGFAWFWLFLASIGVVFGVLSWWIARTVKDNE
jgi:hypothetical protein